MASDTGCDSAVAYLIYQRVDHTNATFSFPVEANAEFDIGRDQVSDTLNLIDGTISNHHLRLHCVTYGENNVANVEPMVYVRVLSRHGVRLSQLAPDGSTSTCFLQKDCSPVLLNHGDNLQLSAKVSITYAAILEHPSEKKRLSSVSQAESKLFANQYTIVPRALGVGGFASVFLAISKRSGRQIACKIVPLPKKPPVPSSNDWTAHKASQEPTRDVRIDRHREKCQELRREFEILKGIDHPNIIRLEKAIYATNHIYIFQELLSGGDLLSYLECKGGLDEPEAAVIIFQILKALDYLHSCGIAHRDIKPENILLTSWRKGARIVLTDFGQARKIVEEGDSEVNAKTMSRMHSMVGTHGYAAPEVYMKIKTAESHHQSGYNEAVDIWSVGCLAGTLLTNTFLFPRERDDYPDESTFPDSNSANLTVAFNLSFLDTSQEWEGISRKCKSFIRACATVDESLRLTVAQALQHPWVAHPGFAAAMHAEYARAIADWTPRTNANDLIEYLKPQLPVTMALKDGHEARVHREIRSHHFPSQTPPLLSQFRTWNTSAQAKMSSTQLSPIDEPIKQLRKPRSDIGGAAQVNEASRAPHETNKHCADDEMSHMSIDDYAPPVIYPVSAMGTQVDLDQSRWQTQLAESMELNERPASKYGVLPRKKVRT